MRDGAIIANVGPCFEMSLFLKKFYLNFAIFMNQQLRLVGYKGKSKSGFVCNFKVYIESMMSRNHKAGESLPLQLNSTLKTQNNLRKI